MSCSAALALCAGLSAAHAADLPTTPVAPLPPVLPTFALFDGIQYHAQFEAGISGNSANPSNGQNIAQLYTDHANTPEINQVLLTVAKPIDPAETGYALGFNLQVLFGADERYNHYLGLFDTFIKDRNQLGILQAYGTAHLPWFFAGGTDVKFGLYSSPMGFETLDPTTTPFYSHSYIYNWGLTFNDLGILTTTHVNNNLDIWLGVDTGNSTTFNGGDDNHQIAGYVGIGLNHLFNDKLTVLALSHIGPEQNRIADPTGYDKDLRYYNVVDFTYKVNDDWTSVTEFNYSLDEFGNGPAGFGPGFPGGSAAAYGGTQYLGYALNKYVTLNARGEVYRDDKGFFVANFPDSLGSPKLLQGFAANPGNIFPGAATYSSITLGLTYKPDVPKPLATVMVRPEVRYERALSGRPFNTDPATPTSFGRSKDQFTFGGDVTIGF